MGGGASCCCCAHEDVEGSGSGGGMVHVAEGAPLEVEGGEELCMWLMDGLEEDGGWLGLQGGFFWLSLPSETDKKNIGLKYCRDI